jgi:hypothetical protein
MRGLRTLALAAALAAGASGLAYAQDPVSAAIGTAGNIAGAAIGTAGNIAGAAVGTAGYTARSVTGSYPYGYYGRACPAGYRFHAGACYLR